MVEAAADRLSQDSEDLALLAEDDQEHAAIGKVHGTWRAKGQSKMLTRAMKACTAKNSFSFAGKPLEFVQAVADKSCVDPSVWPIDTDTSWMPPTFTPTERSLKRFGRPWSATMVRHELDRSKTGKAFSLFSQISKDMLKVLVRTSRRATEINKKIKAHKKGIHSEVVLQQLQEALAAATSKEVCPEAEKAEEEETTLDVCDLIAAIFRIVEVVQEVHPLWLAILLRCLFKDKVDAMAVLTPEEIEHIQADIGMFREISLADALRTLYGSGTTTMWMEFSKANDLHKHAQLAYLPGIDAISLHHIRFDLIQILTVSRGMPWSRSPLCLGVLNADFKHFFSTFNDKSRESTMEENHFPENRRRGLRAIHKGMKMAMAQGGVRTEFVSVNAELQGSAEACVMATAAFTTYNECLFRMDKGFKLPPSETFGLPAPPATTLFGGDQCDDIALFSGGYGVGPKETVDNLESGGKITADWAIGKEFVFSMDQAKPATSKSICYALLTDEYGFHVTINPNIWLPTPEGMMRVPVIDDDTAFKTLGVMRAKNSERQRHENTQTCVNKTLSKVDLLLNTRFPVMSQASALKSSITGSTKWLAKKANVPWAVITATQALECSEYRAAMGMSRSTSTAYIMAAEWCGGCGLTGAVQDVLAGGIEGLLCALNSKDRYLSDLMAYTVDVCRHANGIKIDTKSTFFNWDIEGITLANIDNMNCQVLVAVALRYCITHTAGIMQCCKTGAWMLDIAWDGTDYLTCDPAVIKKVTTQMYHEKWKQLLHETNLDVAMHAATNDIQLRQGNLWRKDRSIAEGVLKTSIKAAIDALPSARNLALWDLIPDATCVCGAECGSTSHISQACPNTHALRVERSAQLVTDVLNATTVRGSSSWTFVGKPGCHPPDFLLPKNWRDLLETVLELKDDKWTPVQHRLPDLILVSCAAGGRITVVICDPTVCWSDITGAQDRKHRAYEPLKQLILKHLGPKADAVHVVPIAFSARGMPPHNWADICAKMRFKRPNDAVLKTCQTHVIEYLDTIFKSWSRQEWARRVA